MKRIRIGQEHLKSVSALLSRERMLQTDRHFLLFILWIRWSML